MYNNDHKKYIIEKDVKDTFGAYLLENAQFAGYYDMPVIDVKVNDYPKHLVAYSQLTSTEIEPNTFCHFYEFDYKFDGRDGIWNSMIQGTYFKRGFNLDKLDRLSGIISPDFSCYLDMPRVMRIWNVYRSRTVCYRLNKLGYLCIPNVRWTDEESYKYAFDGIAKGSAVAIGTLGCSKEEYDKYLFNKGLREMIIRIKPSLIIIYGSLTKEIKNILDTNNQEYVFFPSQTSKYFGGKEWYGNEIK